MSGKVLIGCKLPHGVQLYGTQNQPIIINGMNTSMIAGGYGITTLDDYEWDFLQTQYADYDPMIAKAIFSHGTAAVADIIDLAGDLRSVATGFEGLDPNKPGAKLGEDAKKMEFKPEGDGQDLGKKLEANETATTTGAIPRKKVSKADTAAALAVAQGEAMK